MVAPNFDSTLAAVYREFNVPVDRFFGNEDLAQAFTDALGQRLPDAQLNRQEVMHRLLTLRKKGALPRLRRAYRGRHNN